MKKASLLNDYLERYGAGHPWVLQAGSLEDIEQVVVIPAFAEKDLVFATLASLADNRNESLETSMILCVVNNKANASVSDKQNNADTLGMLNALIQKKPLNHFNCSPHVQACMQKITGRPLRLGYVDASSPGMEISSNAGGVGMARKIGMDMALRLPANSSPIPRLILSLDADTLVQPNYLSAIRNAFVSGKTRTGIVAYEHQIPSDEREQTAICTYEIFLRYWVYGLQYARSPYAFHAIGSTMVTTADSYLAVRGMNRREAGEDFYFLNKLAKTGPIQRIRETVVYPSARVSKRVPFGTGAMIDKMLSGANPDYLFYDPCAFGILKEWLLLIEQSFDRSAEEIIVRAGKIDPCLTSFLLSRSFMSVWPKIRRNTKNEKVLNKQFHHWFDGFETLKLINYLTKEHYPRISQTRALNVMFEMKNRKCAEARTDDHAENLQDQLGILRYLRSVT